MLDFAALAQLSTARKPPGADQEWSELSAFYADQSRATTRSALAKLGVGLKDNAVPFDLGSLLRQAIDRSATVYRRAPSRWLLDEFGTRIDEFDHRHAAMLKVLEAAQYDVAWRRIDRLRTLLGQVCVRFYPSDPRSAILLRTFEPQNVHRLTNPACGDSLDEDEAFALELDGGVVELWSRHPDDRAWRMVWVDKETNKPTPMQPFANQPDFRSPYPFLPVQMVYGDYPSGCAWLPPRQGRQAWIRGLNAITNDVWSLVTHQAHSTRVYKRSDPNSKLPAESGHGVTYNVDVTEDVQDITPSPAIEQSLSVVKALSRLFAISEYLPGNEFDPEKSVLTGAALRVQLQPLYDRREDQVPLVTPDERSAFRRLRGVFNTHAATWGLDPLDESTTLELEIADLEAPATETEAGNLAARQVALGTASIIDLIQRENGCTRPEAIRRYERISRDNELYPPRVASQNEPKTQGPQLSDNAPDAVLDKRASVIDAIAER